MASVEMSAGFFTSRVCLCQSCSIPHVVAVADDAGRAALEPEASVALWEHVTGVLSTWEPPEGLGGSQRPQGDCGFSRPPGGPSEGRFWPLFVMSLDPVRHTSATPGGLPHLEILGSQLKFCSMKCVI